MGQEPSKQQQQQQPQPGGATVHVDPDAAPPTGADRQPPQSQQQQQQQQQLLSAHEAAVDAELRRMLRVRGEAGAAHNGGKLPGHVVRAQELASRLGSLSMPKPPIIASSLDGFMINRHDRTVDEINRKLPLLQGGSHHHHHPQPPQSSSSSSSSCQQTPAAAAAVPNPTDAHRALAALQTHDMAAAQTACANASRIADDAKALDFQAQLTKSTAIQAAHDAHRAAVTVVAECDALCLAVHGVSCRPDVDAASSPMRPTSASNVSPSVPTRHMGLVQLVAEVAALTRQIDSMLSEDDRRAVRDTAATLPVSLSSANASPERRGTTTTTTSTRSSPRSTPPPPSQTAPS